MGASSGNIHLQEERGHLAQTEDEEQLYGSVARDQKVFFIFLIFNF